MGGIVFVLAVNGLVLGALALAVGIDAWAAAADMIRPGWKAAAPLLIGLGCINAALLAFWLLW